MEYRINNNLQISEIQLRDSSGIEYKYINLITEQLSYTKVISNETLKALEIQILMAEAMIIVFWVGFGKFFIERILESYYSSDWEWMVGNILLFIVFSFVLLVVTTLICSENYGFLGRMKETLFALSNYQHFYKLYIQVQNFNTLVDTVNAINISEETGGSNKLEDKDKVYSILKTLRADLILALNIERNFRENPNFTFNEFEINNLETSLFNIQEECNKYGKTLSQAIEISMNVSEEMQKLNRYN